jgi:glycine dehydrogenase subunit 1
MPFIPHTERDTREMLAAIGVDSTEDLFDEIPAELRIGAGAYEHHIPTAVWDIATRGEYYSAYTPYQAEASQGTLQTIYEYQTMITELTGLDVSNASLYDGASGLAEAALMSVRANRRVKSGLILLAPGVNPVYEHVAEAIAGSQGLTFEWLPVDATTGNVAFDKLPEGRNPVAVVMQQPTFPGTLEDVDRLTDWAHAEGAFAIGIANPITLALLKAPGHWGEQGVDIACGEGQPLGVPLSSGGPYFGYMTCKQKHVRQMPGRIVGRTVDLDGKPGFALTLQAREQHIRRSKATSNICTNQGLMVTAATIYMSLLGTEGISQVGRKSHENTTRLVDGLCAIEGIERLYDGPYFHEVALRFDRPVAPVLEALAEKNILGGFDLTRDAGTDALLVCATETKTDADIDACIAAFAEAMS